MTPNERQEYMNKFLELREEGRILMMDFALLELFTDANIKSVLQEGLEVKKQNLVSRYTSLIQEVLPKYGPQVLFEII